MWPANLLGCSGLALSLCLAAAPAGAYFQLSVTPALQTEPVDNAAQVLAHELAQADSRNRTLMTRVGNTSSAIDYSETVPYIASEVDGPVIPEAYIQPRDSEAVAKAKRRMAVRPRGPKVQHVKLLNKVGLWWLMGALIFCIGILVIRMDQTKAPEPKEEAPKSAAEKPASSSNREEAVEAKAAEKAPAKVEDVEDASSFGLRRVLDLAFCVVGLNASMLFWGIAQEYMMTSYYEDEHGKAEMIPNSFCLVLFNRFVTVLLSGSILLVHGRRIVFPGFVAVCLPAGSNLIASWCQYQSLAYVSFPLQTATKSAKLLPVLVMNAMRGKKQGLIDYAEAFVIVSALVIFGFETDHQADQDMHAKQLGVILLGGLLLFDSVTPHLQDSLFQNNPELTTVQMTFAMALIAFSAMLVVILISGQFIVTLSFFMQHPEAILHAIVLSMCSALTQFLISYTIRSFGPVVFTIIATTRQVISVSFSALLFMHHISALAWLAAALVFGTVVARAMRPRDGAPMSDGSASSLPPDDEAAVEDGRPPGQIPRRGSFMEALHSSTMIWRLSVCVVGMHLPLGFYSVAQEFMATHTFQGASFRYPMFLIAANRTGASLFGLLVLKIQGLPAIHSSLLYTSLPAGANFLATLCQYKALYFLRYPAQTLMKSVKVLPVMMCGRLLKNRSYSWLDYGEALLITGLVVFFTWNFNMDKEALTEARGILPGILLMLGYVLADSFTSNAEDIIFQRAHLDPGQMLLGMQAIAAVVGWGSLLISGQLVPAIKFLCAHQQAWIHVGVLVMAEACGAYACTVTVKLFGPAIFSLLLVSHQLVSLLVSVWLFKHSVSWPSCLCLGVLALVVLTSCLRRVTDGTSQKALIHSGVDLKAKRQA